MKTISIETSKPTLEIHSTRAKMEISNRIRRFKLTTTRAQMKVHRQAASFKVDWDRVRSESGLRTPSYLQQYLQGMSKQDVMDAIETINANAEQMLRLEDYIHTKMSPVAEVAIQSMKSRIPSLTTSPMPESLPKVVWDPGYVRIEWTTGDIVVEWEDDFMPNVTVTPHAVEINVKGRSEVKISVNEDKAPKDNGRRLDRRV